MRHGPHQVAQKSTTVTWPRRELSVTVWPARLRVVKFHARVPGEMGGGGAWAPEKSCPREGRVRPARRQTLKITAARRTSDRLGPKRTGALIRIPRPALLGPCAG